MDNLQHLLRDSRGVVDALGNLEHDRSMRLTKIDVKDFYFQGNHVDLMEAVVHGASAGMKSVLQESVWFLLDNQYV